MPEPLRTERYLSSSTIDPYELWDLVGDPARLPEWTDADEVGAPAALEEGAEVRVRADGTAHIWRLLTVAAYGWEATAALPVGEVSIGCRVAADGGRTRLVLVGAIDPRGSRLRARLLTLPRLGARLERWAESGLRLAGS